MIMTVYSHPRSLNSLHKNNIKLSYSSAHMPQAHGGAEAGVKIAKNILQQKYMFNALRTYRCTPTAATGYTFTPYELMIGRNP